jgi:hypothetical protein
MNTFQITNITTLQVADLLTALGTLATKGKELNTYNISGDGIDATAVYNPAGIGILLVTVTTKPWYISLALIKNTLQETINANAKKRAGL